MKNQIFGLWVKLIVLALCILGGNGIALGEDLYQLIVFIEFCFWLVCLITVHDDSAWYRQSHGLIKWLRIAKSNVIGLTIVAAFVFGWTTIGTLHLFTSLLVFGRISIAEARLHPIEEQ